MTSPKSVRVGGKDSPDCNCFLVSRTQTTVMCHFLNQLVSERKTNAHAVSLFPCLVHRRYFTVVLYVLLELRLLMHKIAPACTSLIGGKWGGGGVVGVF